MVHFTYVCEDAKLIEHFKQIFRMEFIAQWKEIYLLMSDFNWSVIKIQ